MRAVRAGAVAFDPKQHFPHPSGDPTAVSLDVRVAVLTREFSPLLGYEVRDRSRSASSRSRLGFPELGHPPDRWSGLVYPFNVTPAHCMDPHLPRGAALRAACFERGLRTFTSRGAWPPGHRRGNPDPDQRCASRSRLRGGSRNEHPMVGEGDLAARAWRPDVSPVRAGVGLGPHWPKLPWPLGDLPRPGPGLLRGRAPGRGAGRRGDAPPCSARRIR
jgi:hypothetical protein